MACSYFPPSIDCKESLKRLLTSLEDFSQNWELPVFLFGDFNARHTIFGDHHNSQRGDVINKIMKEVPLQYCFPAQGKFTTINSTGGRGITDLVFCSHDNAAISNSLVVHENSSLGGSDHRPLTWTFDSNSLAGSFQKGWKWLKFMKDNSLINQYQERLENSKPDFMDFYENGGSVKSDFESTPSKVCFSSKLFSNSMGISFQERLALVDQFWCQFVSWIENALQDSCGRKGEFKAHKDMFWNDELKSQSHTLNEMANNPQSNLMHKRELFKRYAKNRKKRHQELQRVFLDALCSSGNRNQFFRYVKRLNRSRAANALNPEKMEDYENHFKSTFGASPIGSHSLIDDYVLRNSDPKSNGVLEPAFQVNSESVKNIIKHLGRLKASGEDALPAEAFIYGGDVVVSVLTKLFNLMISMQVSPSQWNNSLVCLIFKNKGSNQDVKNYRPISLTIVAKRIFEKAIDKKLDAYKSMLHDLQGGFRKGRSTLHQVYYLAELMKSNKLINVFMDFRAAYDTVDRRILWTSLFHTFKFPISLIRTLRSIFEFNESFLLVGSDKSPGIPNLRGVPQGSSLSPTMFNFFINSLIVQLEAELKANGMDTNCLFFADDGNLHSPNPAIIQVLLNVCHKWSFENGMSFAADKRFWSSLECF
jgi:hypothetical protein